ncbi:molybdate ABC transporter substrate-binding protein [Arthrobacter sp. TMT4-20]
MQTKPELRTGGRRRLLAASSVAVLALTACGAPGDSAEKTLTVFAAASLQSSFTTLAEDFEAANPGMEVILSFAGSSDLATQLSAGAPADVFAAADTATMDRLVQQGLIDEAPVDFASNTLMIAVPPGNPADVADFGDLADPTTKVVLCAPQVPCGAAAAQAQQAAGITVNAVSEESSVTDVLGKVRSGQADAGLVYVTDVLAAGDAVEGIDFDESDQAVTTYPLAAMTAGNVDAARGFLDLVTGPAGRQLLADAGFGAP